ncbi:MAG: hypothetical protein AAGM21_02625 [Pseudomonadota bacterium]
MAKRDWFSNPTQVYWTCKALIEGRTITHKTEIREVRGWRLGAIVHKLREDFGWPITSEFRGGDNIAHYFLPKDCDWTKLRFPPSTKHLLDGEI